MCKVYTKLSRFAGRMKQELVFEDNSLASSRNSVEKWGCNLNNSYVCHLKKMQAPAIKKENVRS